MWRLHPSGPEPPAARAEDPAGRRRAVVTAVSIGVAVVAAIAGTWLVLRFQRRPPVPSGSPSVLALPCKVYGAPEVAFLTDAVPGTISTLLAQVEGLDTKVPPTNLEVEKVKGDLARLAELYQVSSFIVTSLTASPGRFTLNVQLVDAGTRKVRWGQQFEGPRDACNELARQAAEGIRQAVGPHTAPPVPTAAVSSEAELAFRDGTYFFNRYGTHTKQVDFEASLAAYTRALALDRRFAAAAGRLANLNLARFDAEGDLHQARKEASPTRSRPSRSRRATPSLTRSWGSG